MHLQFQLLWRLKQESQEIKTSLNKTPLQKKKKKKQSTEKAGLSPLPLAFKPSIFAQGSYSATHTYTVYLPNDLKVKGPPHTPNSQIGRQMLYKNQGLPDIENKTRIHRPTSLDLLRSRTNFPSSSTSSTATRPLVRACCEKLLRLSEDSSLRFLVTLPPP